MYHYLPSHETNEADDGGKNEEAENDCHVRATVPSSTELTYNMFNLNKDSGPMMRSHVSNLKLEERHSDQM